MKRFVGVLFTAAAICCAALASAQAGENQEAADKVTSYLARASAVSKSRQCWMETRLGVRAIELKEQHTDLQPILAKISDAGLASIARDAYESPLSKDDWANKYFVACTEKILGE